MPEPATWLVLVAVALVASVVGGVAGFGAGVILLPFLVWTLGVRAAIPVLTVTMLLGNLSRVWWSRADTDRGVAGRFLVGAVPATALGAALFVTTPGDVLTRVVGAFLLASVPLRRWLLRGPLTLRLAHFPLVGGAIGLLSALVVTTGPIATPFFLAYGLRRSAYIATEALCATVMHVARGAAFARYRLLTWEVVLVGAALGLTMFAGSWIARRLLERMGDRVFLLLVEGLVIAMGLQCLLFPR
ncbi:MAG TPA: sulfite exporter TauE/SafE family protein [Candidatus Tectomicrobia bacterium]|nr:sulfite exporter TauE/SafE family protein [Candidatus Tectomicrobia bacterium]